MIGLFELTRRRKVIILVIVDSLLIAFANIATYYFMRPFLPVSVDFIQKTILISIGLYWLYGYIFKVFTRINRYTNLREMIAIFAATTCQLVTIMAFLFVSGNRYSRRVEVFAYILSTFLIVASRLAWRLFVEHRNMNGVSDVEAKRTLIIGAGEGGRILYNSLIGSKTAGEIDVIGFVDDDPNKVKTYLSGVKVLGKIKDLPDLIQAHDINMVTIAIPSMSRKNYEKFLILLKI